MPLPAPALARAGVSSARVKRSSHPGDTNTPPAPSVETSLPHSNPVWPRTMDPLGLEHERRPAQWLMDRSEDFTMKPGVWVVSAAGFCRGLHNVRQQISASTCLMGWPRRSGLQILSQDIEIYRRRLLAEHGHYVLQPLTCWDLPDHVNSLVIEGRQDPAFVR